MRENQQKQIDTLMKRLEASRGYIAFDMNYEIKVAAGEEGVQEKNKAMGALEELIFGNKRPDLNFDTELSKVDSTADGYKVLKMLRSTDHNELLTAFSTANFRAEEIASTMSARDKMDLLRLLVELAENHSNKHIHVTAAQTAGIWGSIV